MKSLVALALAGAVAFTSVAFAADPPKAADAKANPQQERMKACNEKGKGKSGDDRSKFMSACLSGEEPAKMTQQEKMGYCNKQAAGKSGDDRKKFMSACLSGDAPAAKMTQQEKMGYCNKQATGKTGEDRKKFMSSCLSG